MRTIQPKSAPLEFPFNKLQMLFHGCLILFHQFLVTRLIVVYAQTYPESTHTSPSYLTPLLGKQRDSHDLQWETYRSNLPVLACCIAGWSLLAGRIERYRNEKAWVLGGTILAYSFRSDLLLYLLILFLWYYFTKKLHRLTYFVHISWFICIATLYLNQFTNHFESLSLACADLMPLECLSGRNRQIGFGQVLNMTFLKLLSYGLDRSRGSEERELEKHRERCEECLDEEYCLKGRNFVEPQDYGLLNYMNYVLFAPTLLTGPPLSFKNFISFRHMPTTKRPELSKLLFLLLSFELFQHYCPVIDLSPTQSFIEAEVMALFHLVFIWFKFLIIWKVARLWSAFCGVQVVDNLSRCVCNNYGFQGFWRMWHRGFNQWLVRYLYIPLGGNQNLMAVVATIAFVAFWHDHTLNIVLWAFALILFILPEILIKRHARKHWAERFGKHWFKYLAALSSAIYIYFLVFSNIVGFGYGADQLYLIGEKIQREWREAVWSVAILTSAVVLMFYQRSLEDGRKNY